MGKYVPGFFALAERQSNENTTRRVAFLLMLAGILAIIGSLYLKMS